MNFFRFIAEEVREILAELGFRSIEEAVGHAETLDVTRAVNHWKGAGPSTWSRCSTCPRCPRARCVTRPSSRTMAWRRRSTTS
ncbi:hypothetical protein LV779_33485 [Streptomyces thinghirensis]|nr:hypothetical protein [Streptomyces thinghirensis]